MNILEIKSLSYSVPDKSAITLIAKIENIPNFIAITCSKFSDEEDKKQFYLDAIKGLHGEIQPYSEEKRITDYDIKCEEIRNKRNILLKESDHLIIIAIEQNKQPAKNIVDYRQALRDITMQPSFPEEVTWPVLN